MKSFKNAIGYIRVSTEQQAKDDKYGIDVQKRLYCCTRMKMGTTLLIGR